MQEKDYNPIERMRHRDTDGDGVADYIDSNGYSKPNDRYRYKNISTDDYRRLQSGGFNFDDGNCCQHPKASGRYILRLTESQSAEVDRILKPVLRRSVSK